MPTTTADLLTKVRRRSGLPPSGSWTDADLFDFATSELRRKLAPWLSNLREEYGVIHKDDVVNPNEQLVRIAPFALADGPRDVRWYQTDGRFYRLSRISLEQEVPYSSPWTTANYPVVYTVEGDYLRLLPVTQTQGTLRQLYVRRPPMLVATSACARVISLTSPSTITVAATIPTTFTVGTKVDIVRGTSPYDALAIGVTLAAGTTGATVVLSTPYPSTLSAGDYVCLTGEACVAPLTDELCEALVTATCAAAWEALSNENQSARFRGILEADLQQLTLSHTPRVQGSLVPILGARSLWGTW